MSKLLITPVESSGIKPFVEDGLYLLQYFAAGSVYHINGSSYPTEIVTILED